jgi:hypothetical protein
MNKRKKSPKQSEKESLLDKKRTADRKWDELLRKLEAGEKVDHCMLAQSMSECNWADYGLIERGLRGLLL